MFSDKIKVYCNSMKIEKDPIVENMLIKEHKKLKHVVDTFTGSEEESEDFYKEMVSDMILIETTFNEIGVSI